MKVQGNILPGWKVFYIHSLVEVSSKYVQQLRREEITKRQTNYYRISNISWGIKSMRSIASLCQLTLKWEGFITIVMVVCDTIRFSIGLRKCVHITTLRSDSAKSYLHKFVLCFFFLCDGLARDKEQVLFFLNLCRITFFRISIDCYGWLYSVFW